MQTFAEFLWHEYNLCHLPNSGHTLCLHCVALALTARVILEEEKSQCHAVRRHFSQTKNCVSTFCCAMKDQHSKPLACFSEVSRGLMGLLFHSICQLASYRPQMSAC